MIREDGADGHAWFKTSKQGSSGGAAAPGPKWERPSSLTAPITIAHSPLYDPLANIGFDEGQIRRILRRFSIRQIQLWSDVTLAALEHKGREFFRRSPRRFS